MEIPICLLLLLLGSLAVINMVQAQSQEGFISLACGMMPETSSYTSPRSTLTFISDARFIDSGESGRIQKEYENSTLRPAWTLRSFPKGKRNCYNLNVTQGTKYLARATFKYGNYDNRDEYPIFDLHIGPNKWATVNLEGIVNGTSREIIHIPQSNNLQVCLVKTGDTTPFISTLELRPLSNDIYKTTTPSGYLVTLLRNFLVKGPINVIRFYDDVHDRFWWYWLSNSNWTQLNTTLDVNTSSVHQPPKRVMQMAATPKNSSEPLTVWWKLGDPNTKMYLCLYFAEIEELNPNETREFNIKLNGEHYYGPLSPKPFFAETICTTSPEECKDGNCLLEFIRTSRSTHPPLLNAVEVYTVVEFQQSKTDQSDVEAIKSIKTFYELNKASWQGDPCAPLEYLWEGLNCTSDPPRITSLNLSSSGLMGIVSPYIQNLTQLKELDLSNNDLTGEVPEFLAEMRLLSVINLGGNMLNGSVPQALLDRERDGSLRLYVQGNPNLYCPLDVCKNKDLHNKAKAHKFVTPVVTSVASLLAIVAVSTIFLLYRKKQSTRTRGALSTARTLESTQPIVLSKERRFTFSEVLRMTNNMEKILGRGGFGTVYHGYLNDTEQVAVKILSQPSSLGHKQFRAEVELLLRVHHKNLVHLVGYCVEGDTSALIYEYMANGDLKNLLTGIGKPGSDILSWASRMKIAAEAAQGLEYLHNGCKPPIVHRDIKTANILLDENFQAKVADFGLSRSFDSESKTHISTVIAGTPGYLDPEYNRTSWLTEKSDVYSFGIALLEIITSQPVLDNARERNHIAEWVNLKLAGGDILNIIDPRLRGEFDTNSLWRTLEVAMACVNPSSSSRPSMGHVAAELKECLAAETARTPGRGAAEWNNSCVDMTLALSDEFTSPMAR